MTSANHTISLNCDPIGPRPSKLLRTLIEGLGLTLDAEYPIDTSLGNWVWIIPPEQHEQYINVRGVVEQRIVKLYEAKLIRYGSWQGVELALDQRLVECSRYRRNMSQTPAGQHLDDRFGAWASPDESFSSKLDPVCAPVSLPSRDDDGKPDGQL